MLLALDTSTLTLSLALLERDAGGAGLRVREAVLEGPPKKQSERLPGVVGELLARHGVALRSLEALVIGLGPGSFTGLRVGMATMKALAYAAKVPLLGASSLAGAAREGPEGVPLLVVAVARQDDLYVGTFRREQGRVVALEPETAMSPAALAERLAREPAAVALGPALVGYREKLRALGVAEERMLRVGEVPLAEHVAALAPLPATFDEQAVFALEPHYVRASEPERNPKFPPLPGPAPTARIKDE